jgi:hypothetical protein
MNQQLEQKGFAIVSNVLSTDEVEGLIVALGMVIGAGRRGLLAMPAVHDFAHLPKILDLARPNLEAEPRPVRVIYFNKTADANWSVAWHQDLTIAVQERVEVPEFTGWSVKEGVPHVQPPEEFLENMLTLRVHLDDCDETNGALKVLAGTHRLGRLSADEIHELSAKHQECLCSAKAGDVMLMRPLLLHASSRSQGIRPRRVLHIEYAGFTLPEPLRWSDRA